MTGVTSAALGDSAAIVRELEVLADDSVAGGYSETVSRKAIAHILALRSLLSSVEDGEGIVRELSGFTPGPWETNEAEHDCPYQDVVIRDTKGRGICRIWFDDAPVPDYNAEQSANARLIKAAPALLARITLDAQEKAALQATLDEVSAAIGDVRYMDPPDGGDVPIAEQVRRMRAELASVKAERDSLGTQLEQIAHERTP